MVRVSDLLAQSSIRLKKAAMWSGARLVKGHVGHKVESSRSGCESSSIRARDRRRIAAASVVVT